MINWKLRIQNKTTLAAMIAWVVGVVYEIIAFFGIIPEVPAKDLSDAIMVLIEVIVGIGVLIDPTTEGIADSRLAMMRKQPTPNDQVN